MEDMKKIREEELSRINTDIDIKYLKSHFDVFYDSFISLSKNARNKLKEAIPKLGNYVIYGERSNLYKIGAHLLSLYPSRYKWQFIQYEQLKNGMFSNDYDDKDVYVNNMHNLVIVYISKGTGQVHSTEEYHLAPFIDRRAIDGLLTIVLCEKEYRLEHSHKLPRVKFFNFFKTKLKDNVRKMDGKNNNPVSSAPKNQGKGINGTSSVY